MNTVRRVFPVALSRFETQLIRGSQDAKCPTTHGFVVETHLVRPRAEGRHIWTSQSQHIVGAYQDVTDSPSPGSR